MARNRASNSVRIVLSLLLALFLALCLGVIFWMFRTGYRLKN